MKANYLGSQNAKIWPAIAVSFVLLLLAVTASAQWSGTTNIYYNGGNVGIGTTGPVAKLEVLGAAYSLPSTSGTTQAGLVTRLRDSRTSGDVVLDIGDAAGNNAMWLQSTDMRSLSVNYALLLNPNGGNVGIGTTSPGTKLDVAGTVYTNNQTLLLWNTGRTLSNSTGIESQASGGLELGTNASGPLTLYTGTVERLRINSSGNVGIGTPSPGYKLDVNGNTNVTGDLSVTGNIKAKFQDLAEWVPSSQQLPTGTVVVLDATKSNQVITSTEAYDTRVAGVISDEPGITLGESGANKVLVATTGRVLVKVDASKGPIKIGDLLVTSDVPGLAMKSEPITIGNRQMHMPGTLIGKALEPLEKGSGKILVLLSLQ